MMNKKKLLMLATAMATALPISLATAATVQMHGKAMFRVAIALSTTEMDFSKIDYTAAPSVVGDFVKIGTNNAELFGGVLSAGAGAVPAAGDVTLTAGTTGETVGVKCAISGVLANAAGKTINIIGVEVKDTDAGVGAFGTGNACNGIGGANAQTKVLDGTDTFKFGGKIDGSTTSNAGAGFGGQYDTSTAGGTNIQVDVVYQ